MKINFRKKPRNNLSNVLKDSSSNLGFSQNYIEDKNNILKIIENFDNPSKNKVLLVSTNKKKNTGVNFVKNLGGASSSLDKKTLLIDCDFINNKLTRSLQFNKSTVGLTDALNDTNLAMEVINTVTPHLQVLPVGSVVDENRFILKFQNFKKLIDIYRDHYDFIVIITTEKRDSFFSEIMYQSVDQVILATLVNAEKRNELQIFRKTIENQGSELMGVVFND